MIVFEYTVVFIFGLLIGSFLNVCIYRIPKNISLITPRSFCPSCKKRIKAWQNIPILSFIILKGRCYYCKEKISLQYPLVELLTSLLFLILWDRFWSHLSPYQLFASLIFISALIVVTFIDMEYLIIPDKITIPMIFLGAISQSLYYLSLRYLMGMLVAGGVIYIFVLLGKLLYGQEGMGGGDVKLGALIGIFIGWKLSLLAIFLSCIIGSIVSIILIILKKKGRRDYIAFGPFLSLGALIALLWGEDILRWYLSRW